MSPFYTHFTDGELRHIKVSNLPKTTQLVNGGNVIWTQAVWLVFCKPQSIHWVSCHAFSIVWRFQPVDSCYSVCGIYIISLMVEFWSSNSLHKSKGCVNSWYPSCLAGAHGVYRKLIMKTSVIITALWKLFKGLTGDEYDLCVSINIIDHVIQQENSF